MIDPSQILTEELNILKAEIITLHEAAGQKASGKTEQGFEIDVNDTVGQLLGYSYVGVLGTGRRPGKVPTEFVDILKRWAQAKGINFSNEKQFTIWANAVKWKIIREGTKLYRSGIHQDIFETPIENLKVRVTKRVSDYFDEQIKISIFQ